MFARVRPMSDKEVAVKDASAVTISHDQHSITISDSKREQGFAFDRVFADAASNKEVRLNGKVYRF